jgi:hypothetical protein
MQQMKPEIKWLKNVKSVLLEALPEARDGQEQSEGDWKPDLCIRWQEAFIRVEVKAIRAPRIAEVEGQLARFALRRNRRVKSQGAVDVIVVGLSKFGPRLEEAVRKFMGENAPNIGWGLLDQSNKAVIVIPDLDLEWRRAPSMPEWRPSFSERRDRKLFTDLNRWMLKVLILRNAPENLWGGPRKRPRHATELAQIAGVSVSKAHHFATAFQQEGYLRKSADGLRMVGLPALLEAWLQDEKNSSPRRSSVRSLLPPPAAMSTNEQQFEPLLPRQAWKESALGGMFAAGRNDLMHTSGRQAPLVHVGKPLSMAMHEWHLESCDLRDAQMILAQPLHPESVFRGIVMQEQGAPLVDLWQIALDAVSSAARGREQAEFIVERILALQEE